MEGCIVGGIDWDNWWIETTDYPGPEGIEISELAKKIAGQIMKFCDANKDGKCTFDEYDDAIWAMDIDLENDDEYWWQYDLAELVGKADWMEYGDYEILDDIVDFDDLALQM